MQENNGIYHINWVSGYAFLTTVFYPFETPRLFTTATTDDLRAAAFTAISGITISLEEIHLKNHCFFGGLKCSNHFKYLKWGEVTAVNQLFRSLS